MYISRLLGTYGAYIKYNSSQEDAWRWMKSTVYADNRTEGKYRVYSWFRHVIWPEEVHSFRHDPPPTHLTL